jgi:site-specific DNA-methyltransferase (adenine-specific)
MEAIVYHRTGAHMIEVPDGSADLVLTSPPYFNSATEALLRAPIRVQTNTEEVRRELASFALELRSVFREIARILKPGGALAVQTKDIRYGGFLLELAGIHRSMVEGLGFGLVTTVYWLRSDAPPYHHSMTRATQVSAYVAPDVEQFQVFAPPCGVAARERGVDVPLNILEKCRSPLWVTPGPGSHKTHPFQSPKEPLRRLIALYTGPGDVVVDPFAGHGTGLGIAVDMRRSAIGYEIDADRVATSNALLKRCLEKLSPKE